MTSPWGQPLKTPTDARKFGLSQGYRVEPEEVRRVEITRRQTEVVDAVLWDGCDYFTAADRLGVNVETVRTHAQLVLNATGYHSMLELAVAVFRDRIKLVIKTGPKMPTSICGGRTKTGKPCQRLTYGRCPTHALPESAVA